MPDALPRPLPVREHNIALAGASANDHDTKKPLQLVEAIDVGPSRNSSTGSHEKEPHHGRNPSATGLHIQTQVMPNATVGSTIYKDVPSIAQPTGDRTQERSSGEFRITSFAGRRSFELERTGSWSASSTSSSPLFSASALGDVTPLPSPISGVSPPGLWKKQGARRSHSNSLTGDGSLLPPTITRSPSKKKKKQAAYGNLIPHVPPWKRHENDASLEQNRSLSEYTPEPLQNVKPRRVTGPSELPLEPGQAMSPNENHLHREAYEPARRDSIAKQGQARNVAASSLPSPPPSNESATDDDEREEHSKSSHEGTELLAVWDATSKQTVRWRALRPLGQGAFSKVVLATRATDEQSYVRETSRPPTADLVAIKIVTHSPVGDSDEERMGISIRREIEIMQSLSHPCLVQLHAFEDTEARALLVLNYCPGGDLFELASQRRELLSPLLIKRIFAELVEATTYLHGESIVHRDIKLENVLLNIPPLSFPTDPRDYPYSLTTLTDLGLSKRVPPPPASQLLTHPCGSADYAAPELLMGEPYDGRATDAWALGVLLYALLEGRLPFDGAGERSGTRSIKHRIARCVWIWVEYGDEDGEWIGDSDAIEHVPGLKKDRATELEDCRQTVEGLLKKVGRGRWSVEKIRNMQWVKDCVTFEGGLRRKP